MLSNKSKIVGAAIGGGSVLKTLVGVGLAMVVTKALSSKSTRSKIFKVGTDIKDIIVGSWVEDTIEKYDEVKETITKGISNGKRKLSKISQSAAS